MKLLKRLFRKRKRPPGAIQPMSDEDFRYWQRRWKKEDGDGPEDQGS